jgi:D-sedoheptulose 7-phosphate isomerase
VSTLQEYLKFHCDILESLKNERSIEELIECISDLSRDNNSIIFTAGNGGSASTAEHFSADLSQMEKRTGIRVRSICLNSQVSLSSAFSNDISYENALVNQLSSYNNCNFLFVGFSASGNSENIVRAMEYSLRLGKEVYCFVGFNGGKMVKLDKVKAVLFSDANRDYGIAENLHLITAHFIIDRLVEKFQKSPL